MAYRVAESGAGVPVWYGPDSRRPVCASDQRRLRELLAPIPELASVTFHDPPFRGIYGLTVEVLIPAGANPVTRGIKLDMLEEFLHGDRVISQVSEHVRRVVGDGRESPACQFKVRCSDR